MRFILALLCLTGTAFAETPLDGSAFNALVKGKTLSFSTGTAPYGVEYYGADQRVIWAFANGDCVKGTWYEAPRNTGPAICFAYDNRDVPQCWHVFDEGGRIRADYLNVPGTTVLYEAVETEPLICDGLSS